MLPAAMLAAVCIMLKKAKKLFWHHKNSRQSLVTGIFIIFTLVFMPSALAAAPNPGHTADQISGGTFSSNDGDFIFNDNIGIGTATANANLSVGGTGTVGDAIHGERNSSIYGTLGTAQAGGHFYNANPSSIYKYGVWSEVNAEGTGSRYGVYGSATTSGAGTSIGVYGYGKTQGVVGTIETPHTVQATNNGVYGALNTSVYGYLGGGGANGYGVYGEATNPSGIGVYGIGTNYGVYGCDNDDCVNVNGILGYNNRGVQGIGTYGLYGTGSSIGVHGTYSGDTDIYGQLGTTTSGVFGQYNSSITGRIGTASAAGDFSHSAASATFTYGVRATANNAGSSTRYGVYGQALGSGSARGVYGEASGSSTNYGIHGKASGGTTNYAGYFEGNVTSDTDFCIGSGGNCLSDAGTGGVGGSGTAGRIPAWNGTTSLNDTYMVYDFANARLGLNEFSPQATIHIKTDANGYGIHLEEPGIGTENWNIGVDSSGDMIFYDETSGAVYFEDGGDVGIGTADPAAKLHVEDGAIIGNNSGTGSVTSNTGVFGTSASFGVYGKVGSNTGYLASTTTGAYGSGSTYGVYGQAGTYGVYGRYDDSNLGYMGSSNTGVYGIGSSYGVYGTNGSSYPQGYLGNDQYGVYGAYNSSIYGYLGGDTYAGYFNGDVRTVGDMSYSSSTTGRNLYVAQTSLGSGTDLLVRAGNAGGFSSPYTGGDLTLAAGNGSGTTFMNGNGGDLLLKSGFSSTSGTGSGYGGDLILDAGDGTSASNVGRIYFRQDGNDKMMIDRDGNVGIGTNNPGEKLEVDGNVTVTDSVYINGGPGLVNGLDVYLSVGDGTDLGGGFINASTYGLYSLIQASNSGWSVQGEAKTVTGGALTVGTLTKDDDTHGNTGVMGWHTSGPEGFLANDSIAVYGDTTGGGDWAGFFRGHINVTDTIYYGGNLTGYGADFAEMLPVSGKAENAEVVCFDKQMKVNRCDKRADPAVAGVVSENPTIIGNAAVKDGVPVAITGIVSTKVTGPVERFDLLTTSSTAGHAEKATIEDFGAIIGKAMEPCEEKTCTIKVLVGLR